MGDRATLAKAKKELEDLYLGVPDESVNLTFQDFAQVRQHNAEKPKPSLSPTMETISEKSQKKSPRSSPLAKLPSLDFSKGLEATFPSPHHHHPQDGGGGVWGHGDHDHDHDHGHHRHHLDHGGDQRSMMYDDMSVAYGPERGVGRRRPGIPHSNICALCCNYIYICRHRCLVCGRVYCRHCVSLGMGEMPEGRKCIQCLGRRFSQRYIHKAGGNVGCCLGYPSVVKQQELKWAERGARRNGESRYGNSVMVSRSRSPVGPATPSRQQHAPATPSFVMNSPYSPYSPTNHHPMPF